MGCLRHTGANKEQRKSCMFNRSVLLHKSLVFTEVNVLSLIILVPFDGFKRVIIEQNALEML